MQIEIAIEQWISGCDAYHSNGENDLQAKEKKIVQIEDGRPNFAKWNTFVNCILLLVNCSSPWQRWTDDSIAGRESIYTRREYFGRP